MDLSTRPVGYSIMNKLQRFVIVGSTREGIEVIGTNSGQAFVEAAAKKHCDLLTRRLQRSLRVVEIAKLGEYDGRPSE